ncbi:hypothetical protein GCM10009733_103270 [Nonomuraea maheshkhaliensis]|uniref:Uncharacterized protein n=1 Tax=Nonomuraea maheshkhaliensis TaxID=419590 RepID=A0ABN2HMT4_9ACTN
MNPLNSNTPGFWSPERLAQRAETERLRKMQQQEAQQQDWMSTVGATLISIINSYTNNVRPAHTHDVEKDFLENYPGSSPADFRAALEALKAAGRVYEVLGREQLMGGRSTSLHVL